MLVRHPDWQKLLAAYLKVAEQRDFERGECDCCTFALDAIKTMTGVDLLPSLRGAYSTGNGARRYIAEQKCSSLEDLARRLAVQYRLEEIPAMFSMVGDVAVVKTGDIGQSLAIRWTRGFTTKAVGKRALVMVADPIIVWRV